MRARFLLLFPLALVGCDDRAAITRAPPTAVPSTQGVAAAEVPGEPEAKLVPIASGDVDVRVREVVSYPWLDAIATYTNLSKTPVFVYGHDPESQVGIVETRSAGGNWVNGLPAFLCGAGLHVVQIGPAESHTFRAVIGNGRDPEGDEFRVSLAYTTSRPLPPDVAGPQEPWVRAVSAAHPLRVGETARR